MYFITAYITFLPLYYYKKSFNQADFLKKLFDKYFLFLYY